MKSVFKYNPERGLARWLIWTIPGTMVLGVVWFLVGCAKSGFWTHWNLIPLWLYLGCSLAYNLVLLLTLYPLSLFEFLLLMLLWGNGSAYVLASYGWEGGLCAGLGLGTWLSGSALEVQAVICFNAVTSTLGRLNILMRSLLTALLLVPIFALAGKFSALLDAHAYQQALWYVGYIALLSLGSWFLAMPLRKAGKAAKKLLKDLPDEALPNTATATKEAPLQS